MTWYHFTLVLANNVFNWLGVCCYRRADEGIVVIWVLWPKPLHQARRGHSHENQWNLHVNEIPFSYERRAPRFALSKRLKVFRKWPIRVGFYFEIRLWENNEKLKNNGITSRRYIWAIDQVWGQDGWISAKFFFFLRVYGPRQSRGP